MLTRDSCLENSIFVARSSLDCYFVAEGEAPRAGFRDASPLQGKKNAEAANARWMAVKHVRTANVLFAVLCI